MPPLGSGYNSKSLIHEAILEDIAHLQNLGAAYGSYKFLEILFIISGGLTVAYMLKLYICLFWEKNPEHQAEYDAMAGQVHEQAHRHGADALCGDSAAAGSPARSALLPHRCTVRALLRTGSHCGTDPLLSSGENLLGAAESIAIGVVVYFAVVRLLLMAKDERGVRVYVNCWPKKLDLEDEVYRPVLLKVLPNGCTLIVRTIAELPERIVLFLRNTLFSKSHQHRQPPVGNRFTYVCGCVMNAIAKALNATFLHRHPMRTDFEYVFDASWKAASAGTHRITRSVSFGLLLLCIGLYFTCAYLLMK